MLRSPAACSGSPASVVHVAVARGVQHVVVVRGAQLHVVVARGVQHVVVVRGAQVHVMVAREVQHVVAVVALLCTVVHVAAERVAKVDGCPMVAIYRAVLMVQRWPHATVCLAL